MPELSTQELYKYRVHAVPREIHAYRHLVRQIATEGIREPVVLLTDGRHVALEEGHKRVEAAMQLGIRSVPVEIRPHRFGYKRRYKFPIGRGLAELLTPAKVEVEKPLTEQPVKKSTARAKKAPAKTRASSRSGAATVRK